MHSLVHDIFVPCCLSLTKEATLESRHLIGCEKNGKLCGNFLQYYVDESDDYAEKTPDYAEISKINQAVPLAFFNV